MHKSIFQPLQKQPAYFTAPIPANAVHVQHYSIKLFSTQIYTNMIVNPVLYSVVYTFIINLIDKNLTRMIIHIKKGKLAFVK